MPNRTFRFSGKAYSTTGDVTVTASFNNTPVFSGTVPTVSGVAPGRNTDPLDLWFTADIDASITGNVPLSITVSNGTAFYGDVDANYSGCDATYDPVTHALVSVQTQPVDFYADCNINTEESDGKLDVKINGVDGVRVVFGESEAGEWQYFVPTNGVFTCQLFVDPTVLLTEPYPYRGRTYPA